MAVRLGVETEAPEMTMVLGGHVAGVVTDASGAPIGGALVSATGCPSITTNSSGAFECNELKARAH